MMAKLKIGGRVDNLECWRSIADIALFYLPRRGMSQGWATCARRHLIRAADGGDVAQIRDEYCEVVYLWWYKNKEFCGRREWKLVALGREIRNWAKIAPACGTATRMHKTTTATQAHHSEQHGSANLSR